MLVANKETIGPAPKSETTRSLVKTEPFEALIIPGERPLWNICVWSGGPRRAFPPAEARRDVLQDASMTCAL